MTLARTHVFDHGTEDTLPAGAGSDAQDVQIVHLSTVEDARPFSVRLARLGVAQRQDRTHEGALQHLVAADGVEHREIGL
jgi:hypothetical protein